VPSKKTLNRENLEALGAQRLAELLIELGTGNAAVKRRLRLELASTQSPSEVAKEIRKRLTAIARSRPFIDWQNRKTLIEDLIAAPRYCESDWRHRSIRIARFDVAIHGARQLNFRTLR
jgi:hypothetical protein